MNDKAREALNDRITAYLAGGGLFNPELANHTAVRDLLIDCRAALQWAASQQAAEGWRPIETAPKDGTEFLAFKPTTGTLIVTYLDSDHPDYDGDTPHVTWDHASLWHATHWKPLPAPPATQGGADDVP